MKNSRTTMTKNLLTIKSSLKFDPDNKSTRNFYFFFGKGKLKYLLIYDHNEVSVHDSNQFMRSHMCQYLEFEFVLLNNLS